MLEYHRKLPHFHPEGFPLFITWRLWGSIAKSRQPRILTPGQAFAAADRELDRASGPRWLADPEIAQLVADGICDQRGKGFFELHAWVVMSNHVHVLITPHVAVEITRWLKASTARKANAILDRKGLPFWLDESWDHWVRNGHEFHRIVRYIEENPVKAGLVSKAEDWPWSSANVNKVGQAYPPAQN